MGAMLAQLRMNTTITIIFLSKYPRKFIICAQYIGKKGPLWIHVTNVSCESEKNVLWGKK